MRSHRRRLPIEHALLAGGIRDLPAMTAALAWLPSDAYGQVLVEADVTDDLPLLPAPLRVTVHRIDPSPEGPGVAVGRAVAAWAGEWMPDEPDERRTVSIWVGEQVDVRCPEIAGLVEPL